MRTESEAGAHVGLHLPHELPSCPYTNICSFHALGFDKVHSAHMLQFQSGPVRGSGDGTYTAHVLTPLDIDPFKARFVRFCAA